MKVIISVNWGRSGVVLGVAVLGAENSRADEHRTQLMSSFLGEAT